MFAAEIDVEARVDVVVVAQHLAGLLDEPLRLVGVGALVQRHLAERRESAALEAVLAGRLRVGGDAAHLLGDGLHVEQPPGRVRREVPAPQVLLQLGGTEEQRACGAERLARQCAPAGSLERGRSRDPQLVGRPALELLAEQHRAVEMVRADLHQLVAGAIVEPAREGFVELRPRRLAQASVCDLGDEDVLEAERALAGDRRAVLEHDEVARDECIERRGDVELGSERLDGALPEHAADHRRALQQLLLGGRQRVDARGDERLDRVRDVVAHPLVLGEHPQRLLEEERVALGLVEHERPLIGRQAAVEAVRELLALLRA